MKCLYSVVCTECSRAHDIANQVPNFNIVSNCDSWSCTAAKKQPDKEFSWQGRQTGHLSSFGEALKNITPR